MNILVIGNGFDLAHGLPTKYEHFLKYTDAFKRFKGIAKQETVERDWKKANDDDKEYILYFANLYEQKRIIFDEIDALILNNVWIDYFWEIYDSRKVEGKDGWIDFESEISRIIRTLDDARRTVLEEINLGKERGKITQQQLHVLASLWEKVGLEYDCVYFDEQDIEHIKMRFLEDLNRLTRCLEIYLDDYVEKKVPKVKLPDIINLDIHCVLSFNYTHTYERFYTINKDKKIEYDYIHGETKADSSIESCNLILGIDEYLDGYAKNKDNWSIQFKKFYQRIYKKTGCKYVDWKKRATGTSLALRKSNDTSLHNIYIVGHSLDITDKDILSCLINIPSAKTTIFYHSQEALGNQINNLVKILGEDELISKVHGSDASIILRKQHETISVEN